MSGHVDTDHLIALNFDETIGHEEGSTSPAHEPSADASTAETALPPSDEMQASILVALDGMPLGALTSPWNTRHTSSEKPPPIMTLLSTAFFWFRIEFAFRNAFVVVLPCALLAYMPATQPHWSAAGVLVTFGIVVHNRSVGMTLMMAIGALKGLVLFIVLGQITYGIDPGRHWAGWGAWFFFVVFAVATFVKGLPSKLGLFLFIIHAVLNYTKGLNKPMVILDSVKAPLVGIAFGIAGSLFPFPRFETFKAEAILDEIFQVQTMLLLGLTDSYFSADHDRRINLVRLRSLRALFDVKIAALNTSMFLSISEVWFKNRQAKVASLRRLAMQLMVSIDSMLDVLERVNNDPAVLDDSALYQVFKKMSYPLFMQNTVELEGVLGRLRQTTDVKDCAVLTGRLRNSREAMQKAFYSIRRDAMMPAWSFGDNKPYKHFPFITNSCFMFPWENAVSSVLAYKPPAAVPWWAWIEDVVTTPIGIARGFWADLVGLVTLQPHRVLDATEAFKLAFTTLTAVSFLLNVKMSSKQDPGVGTGVIAFVMDASPTQNVGKGWRFLLGCVLGSVYGLICTSGSTNLRDNVIWMVVLAGITGFGKVGSKWGETCFFFMFFGLSTMAPGSSEASLVATMQSNVVAMTWLCIVSSFLFPQWSSAMLQKEVAKGIQCTRKALITMLRDFQECVKDTSNCTEAELDAERGQLESYIESARQSTVLQLELINATGDEPSMQEYPLPVQSYIVYNNALKRVVSQLASTMIATRITIRHEKTGPSPQAQCVALVLKPFTTAVEVLLMEIEEALRGAAFASSDLVRRQAEIKRISARIMEDAEQAFCEQARRLTDGSLKMIPFRVPAMQQILHCIQTLPADLDALMLATIELSRLEAV